MDLRRLEHFLAVVDLGTVSAAAIRHHIAQPALSRQLAALEREVGVLLFARGRGRLHLTAAGLAYASLARGLVEHARRVEAAAVGLSSGQPQRLTVAAPMSTLNEVVAPFVAELGPDDPIVTGFDHPALRPPELALGRADVVICAGPASSELTARTLGHVPLCAQVAQDHPFALQARRRLDITELGGQPLVLQSRENMSRVRLDAALASRGLTAHVACESEVELMVQAIAASGRGIGVLTERPRFGLHAIQLFDGDTALNLTLQAVWEPHHYAAPVIDRLAARLAGFLTTVRTEIVTSHGWVPD